MTINQETIRAAIKRARQDPALDTTTRVERTTKQKVSFDM